MRGKRIHLLVVVSLLSIIFVVVASKISSRRDDAGKPSSFTILYTGDTYNYIEPCGCCRNQLGGMPRRATAIKECLREGNPVLILDNGNLVDYYLSNKQKALERKKLLIVGKALTMMGYEGINIGESDLYLSQELSGMIRESGENGVYVSCNVRLKDTPVIPYIIKRVGEGSVGIIGITRALSGIEPGKALGNYLPEVRRKASVVILLSQLGVEENRKIAKEYPWLTAIIGTKDRDVIREGETFILPTGRMGEYLGKAFLRFDDRKGRYDVTVKLIPLSDEIKEDGELRALLDGLYRKHLGIKVEEDGGKMKKVTAEECGKCHRKEYGMWKRTKHAIAFLDLVNNGRGAHQGCVECHGSLENDFENEGKIYQSQLNVQCVVCYRRSGKHHQSGKKLVEKDCMACHDREHSRDFVFSKYVKRIAH